jgi:hypothetical protein
LCILFKLYIIVASIAQIISAHRLKVFEKRKLRKIFGPKREEVRRG